MLYLFVIILHLTLLQLTLVVDVTDDVQKLHYVLLKDIVPRNTHGLAHGIDVTNPSPPLTES